MRAEEIRSWPVVEGWYISPGIPECAVGNRVKLGNRVTLGNRVKLGYGVKLGNRVTLGNWVTLGNRVELGYGVKMGDGVNQAVALGYDARQFALVVALQDGVVMFGAGCHWFTIAEARDHWGKAYTSTGDAAYFQIMIDAAERIGATWMKQQ